MRFFWPTLYITDQDYADDAVLFTDDPGMWTQTLTQFDTACQTMGLHTSWSKTCLQNTVYGPPPHAVCVQAILLKSLTFFLIWALRPVAGQAVQWVSEWVFQLTSKLVAVVQGTFLVPTLTVKQLTVRALLTCYYLQYLRWHSTSNWNIAMPMRAFTAYWA